MPYDPTPSEAAELDQYLKELDPDSALEYREFLTEIDEEDFLGLLEE